MKIGYIRALNHDDFYDKQLKVLNKIECGRIFEDIGDQTTELDHLADFIRENDTIYIYQLDRFGLNVKDLMKLTYDFLERNIFICSVMDNIDTSTTEGELLLKIFSALNLCEQNATRKEVIIPDARFFGRKPEQHLTSIKMPSSMNMTESNTMIPIGRPKGLSSSAKEKAEAAASLYQEGTLSMREIANNLNISTATLYSYLRHEKVI